MTQLARPADESAEGGSAYLEVRDEAGGMTIVHLQGQHLVVGRSSQAQVRLNNPQVSRHHAELFADPFGRWWVRDLGSRNSTKINGRPVGRETVLRIGDLIQVGPFSLTFRQRRTDTELSTQTGSRSVQMTDAPHTRVSVLREDEAAKIDMSHLTTLNEFGRQLMETQEADERRRMLCRLMLRADFHGLSAVVLRLDRADVQRPPEILATPGGGAGEAPYVSRRLLASLRQSQSPVLASTAPSDSGAIEMTMAPRSTAAAEAAIGCPLSGDDGTLDVLYVTFPADFGRAEWLALVALAAQQFQQGEAALAVRQQAERHAAIEQDLARARQIQMRLVPQRPKLAGLDVAIGFEPCRWVGGDYVDALSMADGRTLIVVADVSGKGLPASLTTASLHTMVRAGVRTSGDLVQIVSMLNEYLCQYLDDCSFVTLVALAIDPGGGRLECINAGHPAALVLDSAGGVRLLQEAANLPLGVVPQDFELQVDRVDDGHMLAMFTDGLSEMLDAQGQMVGTDGVARHLRELYREHGARDVHEIRDRVIERFERIQFGAALDDRTFVLARRVGAPPPPAP